MGPGPRPTRGPGTTAELRPLGLRLGGEIDRAAPADIVVMRGEEIARRLAAAAEQRLEEIEIRVELRAGGQVLECRIERDAMHVDAPVFARAGAVRQPALVDQADRKSVV